MRYFLTDGFSKSFFQDELLKSNTGNFLFSFATANEKNGYRTAFDYLKALPPGANIIIDSGAFSAWNSGKKIDRNKLYEFYQAVQKKFPEAYFINLDVIPGSRGHKPTKAQARKACEDSWENYLWFKSKGINVMPVFHEDDDWEFLYKMMKETDYIAISPANDSSVKRRMMWLDKVFSILKADYKTRGLAATSPALLKRYPFYSVDSINWKSSVIFGRASSLKGDKGRVASKLARHKEGRRFLLQRELKHYIQIERDITKLWERRGIKW